MADQRLFVQTQATTLYGSGVVLGATSITLSSLTDLEGNNLAMTDFGALGYGTIEPGTSGQEEAITFSGITQNANGTATLTGVKNQLGKAPYTQTAGILRAHAGGSIFVLPNTAGFYDTLNGKDNDETISGKWIFPEGGSANAPVSGTVYSAPTDDLEYAAKKYVDNVAVAGAPDMNLTTKGVAEEATTAEIDAGTGAGGTSARLAVNPERLSTSIYNTQLPSSDQKDALAGTSGTPSTTNKYVTNDDTATTITASEIPRADAGGSIGQWERGAIKTMTAGETISGTTLPVAVYQDTSDNEFYACDANDTTKLVFTGFGITDGTDGNDIDIKYSGIVSGFTGLAEGTKYYVQDDKTIGTSVGTYEILVGIAISETELVIQHGADEYIGTEAFSFSGTGVDAVDTFTMPDNARTALIKTRFDDGSGNGSGEGQVEIKRKGITSMILVDQYINTGGKNEFQASLSGDTITLTSVRASGNPSTNGTIYYYN